MASLRADLILASASPRRIDLLAQIGIVPNKVLPASIDETPLPHELPLSYAERIARHKAQTIHALHPDALVIAADTVVHCGRRILPKAEEEGVARQCMQLLSGRRHRVTTAVACRTATHNVVKLVTTLVRFKRLSPQEIEQYIASQEWHGKAGGYAIQGCASAFIPAINGSYSNVVGLPLAETSAMLNRLGWKA